MLPQLNSYVLLSFFKHFSDNITKYAGHNNKWKRGTKLFDPIFHKKSPTMIMMMMQNHGLKGYYTGYTSAGYHDEMGGVKPVRVKNFFVWEASNYVFVVVKL